jgi:hypothetical protein
MVISNAPSLTVHARAGRPPFLLTLLAFPEALLAFIAAMLTFMAAMLLSL